VQGGTDSHAHSPGDDGDEGSAHEPLKVPIVVGTRPEAIKLVPVILALRDSPIHEPLVVSTGQHHRMVKEVLDLAGIHPDVQLRVGDARSELNTRVAEVLLRFEDFARQEFEAVGSGNVASPHDVELGRFPAATIVHGDTSSAMAAALSAFHLRIPIVHVESGLRTGGSIASPFPEELNRQVITCLAGLHCAPTATNLENLIREAVPVEQIFVTGNTGIDALQWAAGLEVPLEDPELEAIDASDDRLVVVTAHRRENWGEGLTGIASGVAMLAEANPGVRFVLPMHPNPGVRKTLSGPLADHDNVLLTEPLGYARFARLLARSYFVITDSGGIQEEAPSLGKPVIVTRDTTERVEGVAAGTLRLVGTDPDRIASEGTALLSDPVAYARMSGAQNPYGDGHAAERIVAAMNHIGVGVDPPFQFGSGFNRLSVLAAGGYEDDVAQIDAFGRARLAAMQGSDEVPEAAAAPASVPAEPEDPEVVEGREHWFDEPWAV
jgi:UDP-N-acetylglucosamine 2-epimerase (non-hydrolysing)